MRYELTDYEWTASSRCPKKPRGVPRPMTVVSSMASSGSCDLTPWRDLRMHSVLHHLLHRFVAGVERACGPDYECTGWRP